MCGVSALAPEWDGVKPEAFCDYFIYTEFHRTRDVDLKTDFPHPIRKMQSMRKKIPDSGVDEENLTLRPVFSAER